MPGIFVIHYLQLPHHRHTPRVIPIPNSEGIEIHTIGSFCAIEVGALPCFVLVGRLEEFRSPTIKDLKQEGLVSTVVGQEAIVHAIVIWCENVWYK